MKNSLRFLVVCFLVFSSTRSFSQGMWTWMSGSNSSFSTPVYGTQGVPSVNNSPGPAYGPYCWTDLEGNFWLFGGNSGFADLWKFNPVTLEWTWVKGDGSVSPPPVYGTQGVPSPLNTPGARGFDGHTWVDNAGDLWLFGGYTSGSLGDLWRYKIATNEWTWMSGSSEVDELPNYGLLGISSATNQPGGRVETGSCWKDSNGNLWTYGGFMTTGQMFGDMWMYDPSINEWTWQSGSQSADAPAVYGTQGVFSATNTPGGRMLHGMWTTSCGEFWSFGGAATINLFAKSDLWHYSPSINQWTWVSGSQADNSLGEDGAECEADTGFYPSGRYEHRTTWVDNMDNLWLYGGFTSLATGSDLWVYLANCDKWALMQSGMDFGTQPVHGTLGVPSATNHPGDRAGAGHWQDAAGNFWMFGSAEYSDMWRYTPDLSCLTDQSCLAAAPCDSVPPIANFTASHNLCCSDPCTDFDNLSPAATTYEWHFPGALVDTSSQPNPENVCYPANAGTYDVTLIVTNAFGEDTLTLVDYINITCPATPTITVSSDTLYASAGLSYQWYQDSTLITGATNSFYVFPANGTYSVVVTDGNGCTAANTIGINDAYITGNAVICNYDTLNLYAHGDAPYWWSTLLNPSDTIATDSTLTMFPPVSGFYVLHGDSSADTIQVVVNLPPVVELGNDTTVCTNDFVTLTAGSAGGFIWSNGSTSSTVEASSEGSYSVTVTNASGCTASDTMQLSLFPLPTVQLDDAILCDGLSLELSAPSGLTYLWQNGATVSSIIVSATGTYSVTVSDANQCSASDAAVVTVVTPSVELGNDVELCSDQQATLDATDAFDTYMWSNGASTSSVAVNQTGWYAVTVTLQGCPAYDSVQVTVFNYPFVSLGNDTNLCEGSSVTLDAGDENYIYHWSTLSSNTEITVSQSGLYAVTVSNAGCNTSDSINVIFLECELMFPNAFSPNADGVNDIFKALYVFEPGSFELVIYNRWGEQVYAGNNPKAGWDGTYKGQMCEIGVYAWTCNYAYLAGPQTISGSVTLLK